ncbi:ferredoxin reductase [Mycolicibacterium sp.]|uniref:ferredoxin reductase n=1 Tax=Mycolicibacterium sp. TaxID=2320850 RepID=UPI002600E8C9|nr:ferredoxin reductase [Mycolicibacterium sp.]
MKTQVGLGSLMRALTAPLTTPLVIDDYLKLINPLWSARELRGRIVEVRPETRDSATLVIKPGWGFSFDHQPGQYIGIGVLVDGRWRWRSYSLTSVPRTMVGVPRTAVGGPHTGAGGSRTITITIKAMPEGFLSSHLVGGVRPGTIVRLAAPQGDFVMADPAPARVLFVTAGSGITPVMSMLRTMRRRDQIGDVVHLHCAPTSADVMFAGELAGLQSDRPGYRLLVRATRTEGRLDLADLPAQVPDWRDRQTWVCGPEGLLAGAEKLWSEERLSHRLHMERFAPVRSGASGYGGTVTFARSGAALDCDPATSVLEAGEQAGVRMPFGCRMGICHTCVVSVVQGRVRDLRTGVEQEAGTRVQACVSAPSGDCVVDI